VKVEADEGAPTNVTVDADDSPKPFNVVFDFAGEPSANLSNITFAEGFAAGVINRTGVFYWFSCDSTSELMTCTKLSSYNTTYTYASISQVDKLENGIYYLGSVRRMDLPAHGGNPQWLEDRRQGPLHR
jgi:hypothetical protein